MNSTTKQRAINQHKIKKGLCQRHRPFCIIKTDSRSKSGLTTQVKAPFNLRFLPAFLFDRLLCHRSPLLSSVFRRLRSYPVSLPWQFLLKEVIQPHLPIRLPCYDFTPITSFTFGGVLLAVRLPTSGPPGSHGVTGGVYKARERIHRGMLIRDY